MMFTMPTWEERDWGIATALYRPLDTERFIAVVPSLGRWDVIVGLQADWKTSYNYENRWCFQSLDVAVLAASCWNGEGEPGLWHWHPASGRRRPNGNQDHEYVFRLEDVAGTEATWSGMELKRATTGPWSKADKDRLERAIDQLSNGKSASLEFLRNSLVHAHDLVTEALQGEDGRAASELMPEVCRVDEAGVFWAGDTPYPAATVEKIDLRPPGVLDDEYGINFRIRSACLTFENGFSVLAVWSSLSDSCNKHAVRAGDYFCETPELVEVVLVDPAGGLPPENLMGYVTPGMLRLVLAAARDWEPRG
jgi:hypothetical protein